MGDEWADVEEMLGEEEAAYEKVSLLCRCLIASIASVNIRTINHWTTDNSPSCAAASELQREEFEDKKEHIICVIDARESMYEKNKSNKVRDTDAMRIIACEYLSCGHGMTLAIPPYPPFQAAGLHLRCAGGGG